MKQLISSFYIYTRTADFTSTLKTSFPDTVSLGHFLTGLADEIHEKDRGAEGVEQVAQWIMPTLRKKHKAAAATEALEFGGEEE